MNALREAVVGIFSALAVSLLVVGALALAITEGMVVPEAAPTPATLSAPLVTDAGLDFPELATVTPTRKPTARLVVATTQAPAAICQPVPGWERYTTQAGDNLDALAAARGVSSDKLMEANCLSSTAIIPNTQLYLPRLTPTATLQALTSTQTLTPSETVRPCGPPAGWVRYTIRAKDTLTRLSLIYNVGIPELQFANCMGKSIFLAEGDILYVPNVTPRYTATPTNTPVPPTPVPPTAVPPTAVPTSTPGLALTLSISAVPSSFDKADLSIALTYTLRNSGNVALSGPFTVSEDKGLTVSCPGTPTSLAPNATVACTGAYKTLQADIDAGSVTFQATAAARYNNQVISAKKASLLLLGSQKPDLSVLIKASASTYNAASQTISFTITVSNIGNVTLTTLNASDDPGPITCASQPASLAPGLSYACSASYTTTQADLDSGATITHNAGATAKFGNQNISAKLSTAKVTAVKSPALSLKKSGTLPASFAAGQKAQYQYKLTNTGNVTLAQPFTVTDDKTNVACPGTPTSLAPGSSLNCSAEYVLQAADITANSVTNTATAHAGSIASTQQSLTLAPTAGDSTRAAVGLKFAPE